MRQMTTIENNQQFTVVSESSKACAAHNEANKAMIDMGLEFPWKPSDHIILQEQNEAKANEAIALRAKQEAIVAAEVSSVNPTNVPVRIKSVYSNSSSWSRGRHSGWKMIIGSGYGSDANKTWMAIGEGTRLCITAKQLEKAKAKIAQVASVNAVVEARNNAKQTAEQRTKAFIAANPEFVNLTGFTSFCSGESYYSRWDKRTHFPTAMLVTEDGSVKIGGETFTVAQWTEIYNLRAAQGAALKALKASFATATISPAS
jgi:hypothetical protein